MTAIVLPDIDRSTIEAMKQRFPDLSEFELSLPTRGDVRKSARDISRTADQTIDRLLGRRRAPVWPWIAAGLGLAAIVGVVAAWFVWFRRQTGEQEPEQSELWSRPADDAQQTTMTDAPEMAPDALDVAPGRAGARASGSRSTSGRTTTAAASSASMPYPIEEA